MPIATRLRGHLEGFAILPENRAKPLRDLSNGRQGAAGIQNKWN
jgi:hypothetical protein